jgi:hypothetical protein
MPLLMVASLLYATKSGKNKTAPPERRKKKGGNRIKSVPAFPLK